MDELIRPDMTKQEEDRLYTRFVMCEKAQRFLILEAFEGKAHKVLRMGSFEQYCKDRLGLTFDHSYLSRLVAAARVEREIAGEMFNKLNILDGEKPRLTFRTASEIARLPEDRWKRIYEEHCALKHITQRTPKELHQELKRVVERELRALNPAPEKPTEPKPVRQKPDMTPVVPETYDKGAEFDEEEIDAHGRPEEEAPATVEAEPEETGEQEASAPSSALVYPTHEENSDSVRLSSAVKLLRTFYHAYKNQDTETLLGLFKDTAAFLKAGNDL